MGMSSSQARLLHLTGRMHQIEYKAQKLEAQKLQLANDSNRVYNEYLTALDATKIQYKAYASDGSPTFVDATMNSLQNGIVSQTGDTSLDILFMQDANGKMMLTPTVANKYGLQSTTDETRTLDEFVHETTGENKSRRTKYSTRTVTDTNNILSSTKIANNVRTIPNITSSHTYAPIENIAGGIDYSALAGYSNFNPAHSASTSGATAIDTSTTALTAGATYTISDVEGLKQLAALGDATNTAGTTIILANDIDMSSVTNWAGIKNFAGTFDGNGHKITNLTGTQGLFDSTSNATIKNVGLENVNINGNTAYVGGLVGKADTTSITNCYTTGEIRNSYSGSTINPTNSTFSNGTGGLVGNTCTPGGATAVFDNVYSSANVTATASDGVGGLIGSGSVGYTGGQFDIKNAYAIGNVTGRNCVGGFAGVLYNDEDNSSDITDIRNCYSGGNVTGSDKVGGFFGAYLYWGDNNDRCEIEKCNSTGKVNATGSDKGAFAGHLYVKMQSVTTANLDKYLIQFKDCGYSSDTGVANAYGAITDENGNTTATIDSVTKTIDEFVQSSGASTGLVSFKMAGSIPSTADYKQNIIAALIKAGIYDPCDPDNTDTTTDGKIDTFLNKFNNNDTDNTKLWYLNEAIVAYLKGTGSSDLGAKLGMDITTGSTSNTASYQTGAILDGSVKRAVDTGSAVVTPTHNNQKGEVTIPSANNIAEQLYYTLRAKGKSETDITLAEVKSWINGNYNTSDANDKTCLANINECIQNNSNLETIYSNIKNGTKYNNTAKYPADEWNITVDSDKTITANYGTKTETYPDGVEEYWDTSKENIANAIAMYALAKRHGITVVTPEQAESIDFLSNMVGQNGAVLTTFDPSKVADFAALSETERDSMDDSEYNAFMGINNTSVSIRTSLREVSDDRNIKKAEAKYEAEMNEINKKDTKYDTQLAAVETERDATKDELDSLKNVINDNVDRTFKLFS